VAKRNTDEKEPAAKKTLKDNRVSLSDHGDMNTVETRAGDTTLLLLLDTGAQISVLPEEVVR